MLLETPMTEQQYDAFIDKCKQIFAQKTHDYGTAWRVLRTISIIDQIYIKAQRIRTIQEKGLQMVADNIEEEFMGIINYATIGLIQLHLSEDAPEELGETEAVALYSSQLNAAKSLMLKKNHDYGEAWRNMQVESLTDLILMKVHRAKQIIINKGKTLISEGIDANYFDMINYAVFALILIGEQ
ncbi:MAG: DUF1599 domain-containing protein [Flavisolibacter sp.]|nr:DUF1599 domain-containing protein [Flavisolibacter sp.]